MASKYFDIADGRYGMTMRFYYEESLGVVTITNIQLQSIEYTGPYWYPNGTIKVGDQDIFSMNYYTPTHVFDVRNASEEWRNIRAFSTGTELPVTSTAILDANTTEITVDIGLFRDSDLDIHPNIRGSIKINLTGGLVYIDNGSGFEPCEVYIDNGESWDRCVLYIDNGTSWDLCM